jgi:hypothetical protein
MGSVCQGSCYQEDTSGHLVLDETGFARDKSRRPFGWRHGGALLCSIDDTIVHYDVLALDIRFPIKGSSVSVVVCGVVSSLYAIRFDNVVSIRSREHLPLRRIQKGFTCPSSGSLRCQPRHVLELRYTQAEGNKQPHGLVGKPSLFLSDPAHILSLRWCGARLVSAFPAEKALGGFLSCFPASVRVATAWALVNATSGSSGKGPYPAAAVPGAPGSANATSKVRYHQRWHPIECVEERECNSALDADPIECVEECECNSALEADASVGL